MVFYRGEMKPEDTRHLFSPTRLIRIELSTLLGLMVKKEIDYTLPSRSTLRALVQRTEELLDELHRAIDSACFPKLDATTFAHITPDVFKSGHSFREPIFYAGESAYSFQYHDFSAKKYLNDNNWIETNKGFSINAARDVVQAIANLQNAKLTALLHELRNVPIEERAVLPGFSFTLEEVSNASHVNEPVAAKVLAAFAVSSGSRNEGFRTLHDFNAMNATPILRAPDGTFLSFQQYSLAEALYDSPFYWMLEDKSYINEANDHRGKFTEAFSEERLAAVFGDGNVFRNAVIQRTKGERAGEVDVLVLFGDRAIVLQAKSKRLTLEARRGNDGQIKDDFKKSIQDSYDQGYECARLLDNPNCAALAADGRRIQVPRLKELYILCVVSDNYPALSFQALQFLHSQADEKIKPPFVIDVFTLDAMTEMLDSPLQFLSYLNRRTFYSGKLVCSHEMVILSHHLKRNLWLEKDVDTVMFEDGLVADLDVAMSVRRESIPGKRTPEGILTRLANTAIGRFLRDIEARPDPRTIDLGFLLLTLSEDAVNGVSRAIELTARKALRDRQHHDISVPLSEVSSGLTVHCNEDALGIAGARLKNHCAARKYKQRADTWFGICIWPNGSLRFGINLETNWQFDPEMEKLTGRLGKPQAFAAAVASMTGRPKVGRNDPCPCDSGKKYKRCCGA
jgi:hypothetical protein